MERLKEQLLNMGASLVGFGKISGLYQECDPSETNVMEQEHTCSKIEKYPYGISIAVKLSKEIVNGIVNGPTIDYYNEFKATTQTLDYLATYTEKYLTDLGYHAYAQTVNRTKEDDKLETIMPHKTVAVAAGIGWIGKNTLLVTKQYGSAIRLTSVLTDAMLDCNTEIMDGLCENCMICKDECPAGAITGNEWSKSKDRSWIIDAARCKKVAREIAYQSLEKEITLCGKCIAVCPYTIKYAKS